MLLLNNQTSKSKEILPYDIRLGARKKKKSKSVFVHRLSFPNLRRTASETFHTLHLAKNNGRYRKYALPFPAAC